MERCIYIFFFFTKWTPCRQCIILNESRLDAIVKINDDVDKSLDSLTFIALVSIEPFGALARSFTRI